MSTKIYSRLPQRKLMVAILESANRFKKVFPYFPLAVSGESPLACVSSLSSGPTLVEVNKANGLLVTIMVARDNPEEAEDLIDELGVVVREAMLANFSSAEWHNLIFDDQPSVVGYWPTAETAGVQYRFEDIFVTPQSEC